MEPNEQPIDTEAITLTEEAMKVFHPGGGNEHAPEWQPDQHGDRYLGVSTLVKRSAVEYATRIINKVIDIDESAGYWARRGNTLCKAHLEHITPFRENRVHREIIEGWNLVGHMDGVSVYSHRMNNLSFDKDRYRSWRISNHLLVEEVKSHNIATDSKVDLAARQAALYAALLNGMMEGQRAKPYPWLGLNVADFADKGAESLPIATYDGARWDVWGIRIHIDQGTEPKGFVQVQRLSTDDMAKVLDFYMRKAKAILASVATSTLDAALAWDTSPDGLQEFERPIQAVLAGIDAEELSAVAIAHDEARLQVAKWEGIKKDRSAVGCALLSKSGHDSVLCPTPLGEARTTMATSSSGSRYLKVTIHRQIKTGDAKQ